MMLIKEVSNTINHRETNRATELAQWKRCHKGMSRLREQQLDDWGDHRSTKTRIWWRQPRRAVNPYGADGL